MTAIAPRPNPGRPPPARRAPMPAMADPFRGTSHDRIAAIECAFVCRGLLRVSCRERWERGRRCDRLSAGLSDELVQCEGQGRVMDWPAESGQNTSRHQAVAA